MKTLILASKVKHKRTLSNTWLQKVISKMHRCPHPEFLYIWPIALKCGTEDFEAEKEKRRWNDLILYETGPSLHVWCWLPAMNHSQSRWPELRVRFFLTFKELSRRQDFVISIDHNDYHSCDLSFAFMKHNCVNDNSLPPITKKNWPLTFLLLITKKRFMKYPPGQAITVGTSTFLMVTIWGLNPTKYEKN